MVLLFKDVRYHSINVSSSFFLSTSLIPAVLTIYNTIRPCATFHFLPSFFRIVRRCFSVQKKLRLPKSRRSFFANSDDALPIPSAIIPYRGKCALPRGVLSSLVVEGVVALEQQLRHRHNLVFRRFETTPFSVFFTVSRFRRISAGSPRAVRAWRCPAGRGRRRDRDAGALPAPSFQNQSHGFGCTYVSVNSSA